MVKRKEKSRVQWLEALEEFIDDNIGKGNLSVTELARLMCLSVRQLERNLKEFTAQTPNQYLHKKRMERAYEYLARGTYPTIKATAKAVGFSDPVYFAKKFKKQFGVLPSEV